MWLIPANQTYGYCGSSSTGCVERSLDREYPLRTVLRGTWSETPPSLVLRGNEFEAETTLSFLRVNDEVRVGCTATYVTAASGNFFK
jgi:hypothetical protein